MGYYIGIHLIIGHDLEDRLRHFTLEYKNAIAKGTAFENFRTRVKARESSTRVCTACGRHISHARRSESNSLGTFHWYCNPRHPGGYDERLMAAVWYKVLLLSPRRIPVRN